MAEQELLSSSDIQNVYAKSPDMLDIAKVDLGFYTIISKDQPGKIGTLQINKTQKELGFAHDYLMIEYKQLMPDHKLKLSVLQSAIIAKGTNWLWKSNVVGDLKRTSVYLMYHKDPEIRKQYRALNRNKLNFPLLDSHNIGYSEYHYIEEETAKKLGGLCRETRLNDKFAYVMADILGSVYFMTALEDIPDKVVYDSLKNEVDNFYNTLVKKSSVIKIEYGMFKNDHGTITLDNIDEEIVKTLQSKGIDTDNIDNRLIEGDYE